MKKIILKILETLLRNLFRSWSKVLDKRREVIILEEYLKEQETEKVA